MLFSATLSHRVLELAYEHMNNPELVRIEPDKMTVDSVRQALYFPSTEEKIPLLMGLLRRIDAQRTIAQIIGERGDRDRARDFFQALWHWDQIVLDASAGQGAR